MNNQNPLAFFLKGVLFLIICLFSNYAASQCAGSDGSEIVCNKDADEANKTFDLFPHLEGSPTAGGMWSTNDPANFFALNRSTGIVNLWEVKNSGIHEFTYTNTACGESAVVTISLGGYPGEDNIDGSADACGDDPRVNLNGYIGSQTEGKFHDFNGLWEAVTPTAAAHLTDNFFDAQSAGIGIYEFTHTVPAVATCASRQVLLLLEVQRPANSGIPSNLIVCTTDDLSGLTNFNLNDLLTNEDTNGTWSESPQTNQLEDLTDNIIDVQAIRDLNISGTFEFTYLVFPGHPVCEEMRTTVEIIILPTLQGTMQADNYCEGDATYRIEITDYNDTLIPSGTYTATYSTSSISGGGGEDVPLVLRNDKTGFFEIDADDVIRNEVTTLSITSLGPTVCPDIQVAPVTFLVSDPNVVITDSCFEEEVPVAFSNIFDASFSRANGDYDVTYTITPPSGTVTTATQSNINFTNGSAAMTIPANEITETGDYEIAFEVDSGFPLGCQITAMVTITAIPSAIDLDLVVDNSCNATRIDVLVDAPILDDGSYSIVYDVTQQSTGAVVINNTIDFVGGTASYQLDVASLEQGNYTVSVRSVQDDTTLCRKIFEFEENENFAIDGIPELAEGDENQLFCRGEFGINGPTLQDIAITANGEILFYEDETSTTALSNDTPLVSGEDYFVANIDANNNCEGSQRIGVTVEIIDPVMPSSPVLNPAFCASDGVTLAELTISSPDGSAIAWFDAATDGNLLDGSTVVTDGTSYFAATEVVNGCLSQNRLEIVTTVYALESASLLFDRIELCGLDNPTVADLDQLESTTDYEVIWYDAPENGTELTSATPLSEDVTYYAQSYNPETGCINPERIAVTVDLSNCNPEAYDFFIPDGFSPNGDGRNDTFFVPNVETIYPDFTLQILNRYGSSLFKGNRNNPAWDGSGTGGTAPNGVYFYIIEFNKDGRAAEQGRLYLNR
ncbi:gliding motility-associated C-terminal domain-containing protein [Aggregatimonas sangjinii]|uniref:Gliding motility-associated C-terminal domain-containing protein n=1 Tax=Aggregatimonas sangjinii TaxID=2583587 RepID=A0A5B7SVQ9_9FLAO|nr:gliding motility-associated C-terminal domain-containing protein [Aggregatimonas sangjinii]QCX01098.1 gliding motility-associated C-terminal domain-containing protein [Aggregatimonas sangjinii]